MSILPPDFPDFHAPEVGGGHLVLATTTINVAAGGQNSVGIIDVSQLAQLYLQVTSQTSINSSYLFPFYADSAGTVPMGGWPTYWSGATGVANLIATPTGPYMNVTINNLSGAGANYQVTVKGVPSSVDRAQLMPPVVLATFNQLVPSVTGVLIPMTTQAPGPASLTVTQTAAPCYAYIESWNGAGWDRTGAVPMANANLGVSGDILLPWSDSRLNIFNAAGAASAMIGALVAPL